MAADPAILKRIRGCPFARGGRVVSGGLPPFFNGSDRGVCFA